MDAVYYFETEDGLSLLRFYEDGTVIKTFVISTAEKMSDILKWFNPEHNNISKGKYTKRGKFITFEVSRGSGFVVSTGTFIDNDKLRLYTHSHVNDYKNENMYSLYTLEKK